MFELAAVWSTCARIECASRKGINYLGTHLALNIQCLQFYQSEGALLNLPNWNPEASARIIGRKICQMRRKIKESKQKEDSLGCNYFREETGELLSHVCFKCGTMGPLLAEESFKMTFVGDREDGFGLWKCSGCFGQNPAFDELKKILEDEGERLRSGDLLQERELKAVTLQGSGQVIFVPSNLTEGCIDGPYNGPTCSSAVLVPTLPAAIDTIMKACDKAHQERTDLDNYLENLLKRPIITDFQDFLSCIYRSMEARVRSAMAKIFKALSGIARGEILSTNPNVTSARKKIPHLRMTVEGALQQVYLMICFC